MSFIKLNFMKRSNSDKDIILITGATGHLATYLSSYLSDKYELRFLSTKKTIVDSKRYFYWNINKKFIDPNCVKNCKYVIHLAGYSILNRWSKKNKNNMKVVLILPKCYMNFLNQKI